MDPNHQSKLRNDLSAMKRYTLTLISCLALCLAVPVTVAGESSDVALAKSESPDGAWVLRLEAPFVKDLPAWMPLRIDLEIAGGKPVQAVASAIHLNLNWHSVDVTGLRLEGGRLSGSLAVTFQSDDYEKGVVAASAKAPNPRDRGKDRFAGLPAQVIAVDIPLGTITGAAPGTAKIEVSGGKKQLTVAARAWRPIPAAAGAPRSVEFQILQWDAIKPRQRSAIESRHASQTYGALLLRGILLPDGSTRDWICLQAPVFHYVQSADLLWSVENAKITLNQGDLSGAFDLVPTKDEKLRALARGEPKFTPLPEQALAVRLKARLIGTRVAGAAEMAHATPTTSTVLGQVRTQPFARHADRTPRTWAFTAEADPALVAAAEKEASTPLRPGEPGKTWFWTESAMYGGYDIFQADGKKIVAFDFRPPLDGKLYGSEDVEVYRAKLIARGKDAGFSGIAPPTFNLPAIPGAARYRFSVGTDSAESPVRHAVPPDLWRRLPATGQGQKLTIQGLDGAGQNVGEAVTISVTRMPAFQGPYFKTLPRTCREAALLSARWISDNPVHTVSRLNHGLHDRLCLNHNNDIQLWSNTFGALYAGLFLAQTSPDPAEREHGLDLAITVGEVWMRSFAIAYLPDTYKGWAFDQWVYGIGWLELYRLTGDPRWRDLVMEHAKRLCSKQMPSGAWTETDPDSGGTAYDAALGRPKMMSLQGPTMQQWDPSSTLYYLGRIRKDLKTDDFRAAEDKAWQWLQENSIARFDWRRQGPQESTQQKQPWPVLPDCALQCYEYLALDLPGRTADPALMEDLLRWSEERSVDWRRQAHPTQVFPQGSSHRDAQLRLARACARQAQRTGSALWKAKAEALVGARLTAQFPTTGQIPHVQEVDVVLNLSGGSSPGASITSMCGEYGTMALLDLAALWEPAKP